MSGLLGEGMQMGTAENGVLVLLSSNPGRDEHRFVCTHAPVVTMGPGISASGWGSSEREWPLLGLS